MGVRITRLHSNGLAEIIDGSWQVPLLCQCPTQVRVRKRGIRSELGSLLDNPNGIAKFGNRLICSSFFHEQIAQIVKSLEQPSIEANGIAISLHGFQPRP